MDRIDQVREYAREAMQWAESAATEAERNALDGVVYAFAMAAFLEWRDTCFRQPNLISAAPDDGNGDQKGERQREGGSG
jgi:hypothetical protein